jgi:hypothetical protein
MPYPVTLIGGTDRLQLTPGGRVYEVGDVIHDLSDKQRLSLQANGVRFAAVHEDDQPQAAIAEAEPEIPPDQAELNAEIAASSALPKEGRK